MSFKKYKYYFKKPKSEITKDILKALLITGVICVAGQSPYFVRNLMKNFKKWKKYPPKKIYNSFYSLKKQSCIEIKNINRQIYISLTPEGRKKAGIFQINNLKIKKPKKWDKKWRIIIFDIPNLKNMCREALRGKIKELKFYQLQKSVWVYPFDCEAEIELLKDFFGLSEKEIILIIAEKIPNDENLKKFFKL